MSDKLRSAMKSADGDRGRRRDMFDALADPVREQIHSGELMPGALVPSESRLARSAGMTRYSARKALARLHQEGLIAPSAGRGWVVRDRAPGAADVGRLPRYRQIAGALRAEIDAGRLGPGVALPSEAVLVAQHDVSRATVRQALALLEADGVIRTRPGSGRYVC